MWKKNSHTYYHLLLSKFSVIIHGLETTLEVTKMEFGTTSDPDLGDLISMLLKLSSCCNSVSDVLVVVGVSWNGETDKVEDTLALFLVLLIPLEGEGTKLAWTNTVETDHLDDEANTTKVVDLHVGALEEFSHIKVHGMTTRRHHNTLDARLHHIDGELAHLEATSVHVLRQKNLTQANGKSESITTTDTTVSWVTITKSLNLLEDDTDVLAGELGEALLEEAIVTEAEHTTHVAKTILLGAHGEDIAVAEHLTDDITEGSAVGAIGLLELLDEPGVISETSSVEEDRDASLVGDLSDSAKVGHADGLTGGSVVGDGHEDEWDVLVVLLDHLLVAVEIDVALEGVLGVDLAGIERLEEVRSEEVLGNEAVSGGVGLGGVEEAVGRDDPGLGDTALLEGAADGGVQERLCAATLADDEHVGRGLTGLAEQSECVWVVGRGVLHLAHPPLLGPVVTSAGSVQAAALRGALCRVGREGVESVADGVGEGEEAVVATAGLVTTNDAGPLCVGHGSGTTVRKVVDKEHGGWEGEGVVLCGIENSLTLLLSDHMALANNISAAGRLNSAKLLLANC